MSEEETKVEVPIIQAEFAEHLAKYRIKKEMVNTIAENIAEVGGPTIFEDPELLNKQLTSWSQYIGATLRKQILDHWFAKKGVPVSEEVAKRFALSPTETKTDTKKEARKKKTAEGEVWVIKVDDKGIPRITMATEDETGISLDEAKKAVAEIRKSYVGEEPLVVFDEKTGRHMPNFKSEFVKANPMIAWAAAKQMDRAMAEGTEVDPMDVFMEQLARVEQMKAVVGARPEPETKGTIGELISGVKDLQAMAKEGKVELPSWLSDPAAFIETVQRVAGGEAKGLPNWMTDPAAFVETVQRVSGGEAKGLPNWMTDPVAFTDTMKRMAGGEAKGIPSWMTDPAEFIRTIRTISPEPKTDEGLKTELAEVRKSLDDMREERYKEQITSQQQQIQALTKEFGELKDYLVEMKRPITGRTEMDIIHEVATEGIGLAKTELSGLRRDIKEALGSTALPPPKTAEERDRRKARYREAIESDEKIDKIGRRLFFGET